METRTASLAFRLGGAGAVLVALWTVPVAGQTTERVSVHTNGVQGNGDSQVSSMSADGRYVAFESRAINLVTPDTNGRSDVFVRDRQSMRTERVSVASGGTQGDGDSSNAWISANGRYVAFASVATNLVGGDTNGFSDVFVRDRQSETTERLSVHSSGAQGNGLSNVPSISADGRYVVFQSVATSLVDGDTNGRADIFVRDRQTGTTERVSVSSSGTQANGDNNAAAISADGRYVAFASTANNLVSGDTNTDTDIFVRDRQSATTERVSVDSSGTQGDGQSWSSPSLSADGRYVAFQSHATNLVGDDTNGFQDIFVRDRQSGTTGRVSVDSTGAQGNGGSHWPSLSADGRYVTFMSEATNLVGGDTNSVDDIFVHDRLSGRTERVSVHSSGAQANANSFLPSFSADGRNVAFTSIATNLVNGDTNADLDVFVRSRGPAPTVRPMGSNCAAPYLTWSGSPSLGGVYRVTTVNLGTDSQLLLVDWSNVPGLPRTLRVGGAPCRIMLSPDATYDLGHVPDYDFPIADDPALLGVHLRTQALVLSSPAATTQVLDARIGL